MARTPRHESTEHRYGLPRQRGVSPPRRDQEPPAWTSNQRDEEADDAFDEEDEDLDETEDEILLNDDFSDVSDSDEDDEDQL